MIEFTRRVRVFAYVKPIREGPAWVLAGTELVELGYVDGPKILPA